MAGKETSRPFSLGLDRLFEAREFGARRGGVRADPAFVDIVDRHRVEMVPAFAAAAFGAILYSVVTGDSIVGALTNIINRALNTKV